MQEKLQICFQDVEESSAVRDAIEKEVERLHHFFPKILSCRMSVSAPHHHHRKGNGFEVRIQLHVPGKEITVNPHENGHSDLYVAISDSFSSITRRLQDYSRKRRGDVKHHEFTESKEINFA